MGAAASRRRAHPESEGRRHCAAPARARRRTCRCRRSVGRRCRSHTIAWAARRSPTGGWEADWRPGHRRPNRGAGRRGRWPGAGRHDAARRPAGLRYKAPSGSPGAGAMTRRSTQQANGSCSRPPGGRTRVGSSPHLEPVEVDALVVEPTGCRRTLPDSGKSVERTRGISRNPARSSGTPGLHRADEESGHRVVEGRPPKHEARLSSRQQVRYQAMPPGKGLILPSVLTGQVREMRGKSVTRTGGPLSRGAEKRV